MSEEVVGVLVHQNKIRIARRTAAICALGTVTVVLAACSSSGSASGGGSTTKSSSGSKSAYVVGLTTDLSGPLAQFGAAEKNAWAAEFNMVNANGGIDGHPIKLVTLDDQTNPATAQANAIQLTEQDNAIAIGGSIADNICSQLAPVVTSHQVPMLCGAVDTGHLSPAQKYVFDMYDNESAMAQPALEWTKSHFNRSGIKIVIVHSAFPAAEAFATNVQASASSYGASVVKTIDQSATAPPDMETAATQIVSSKADIVFLESTGAGIEQLQNDLQALGASVPVITLNTSYPAFQESPNPNLLFQFNEVAFVNPSDNEPAAKNYTEWMGKLGVSGGAALNPSNGVVYYAGAADIAAALKLCGDNCTGSTLASALTSSHVNLPGVTNGSGFGYSATSHLPNSATSVYQWDPSTKAPKAVAQNVKLGSI